MRRIGFLIASSRLDTATSFQSKMRFHSIKAIYHGEHREKPNQRETSGSANRCRCGYSFQSKMMFHSIKAITTENTKNSEKSQIEEVYCFLEIRCRYGYELPKQGCFGRAYRDIFTASRRSVYTYSEPQVKIKVRLCYSTNLKVKIKAK